MKMKQLTSKRTMILPSVAIPLAAVALASSAFGATLITTQVNKNTGGIFNSPITATADNLTTLGTSDWAYYAWNTTTIVEANSMDGGAGLGALTSNKTTGIGSARANANFGFTNGTSPVSMPQVSIAVPDSNAKVLRMRLPSSPSRFPFRFRRTHSMLGLAIRSQPLALACSTLWALKLVHPQATAEALATHSQLRSTNSTTVAISRASVLANYASQ